MPTNTKALQVAEPVAQIAGKNAVINGGFDIWQRGTSFSLAASTNATNGFTADRWQTATGANEAVTVSRQSTADSTNLPNIQYCLRYQRNSGQTGTGSIFLNQSLETVNSIPFAGKTVTFSFYARKGANYSPTSSALVFYADYGTGTDQNPMIGSYTGDTSITTGTATLTTTWQKFTATGTVGSTATEMYLGFRYDPTGTAGANDYFEITGVQLELGNTATPFSRAGGTIAGELAACQRYYFRTNPGANTYGRIGFARSNSSTNMEFMQAFPAPMRIAPTSVEYASLTTTGANNVTAVALNQPTTNIGSVDMTTTGITANVMYTIMGNNTTNAYLGFSAEL